LPSISGAWRSAGEEIHDVVLCEVLLSRNHSKHVRKTTAIPSRMKPEIKSTKIIIGPSFSLKDHHGTPPRCCVIRLASMMPGGISQGILALRKTEKNIAQIDQFRKAILYAQEWHRSDRKDLEIHNRSTTELERKQAR
jgi:hypothetical protein